MKKVLVLLMVLCIFGSLCACGGEKADGPEDLIVGTWKGSYGFFTFRENGHFSCDFQDAVVGDGEYTITENTLTISYIRSNGREKVIEMQLISLTEDTLSFADSQSTYVLYKD